MKKINKKIKIGLITMFIIFIILYFIFCVYKYIKLPHLGDYYISKFDENNVLLEEDYNKILNILTLENVEISKVAADIEFRHEGSFYIYFQSDFEIESNEIINSIKEKNGIDSCHLYEISNENNKFEYALEHICGLTFDCEAYQNIERISRQYYKWWEDNEKSIDYVWYSHFNL